MSSNPTTDNDLQKAIDEITNSTNSDPIFADPVAAPAPIPVQNPMEGFGSAPIPPAAQAMQQATPAPNHAAMPVRPPMPPMPNQSPARPAARPAQNSNQNQAQRPAPRPMANNNNRPAMPMARPANAPANAPRPPMPARPAMPVAPNPMRGAAPTSATNSVKMESFQMEYQEPATPNYNTGVSKPNSNALMAPEMSEIRDAALRDLSKVIDKLDVTPAEKFDVYKEVHENFGDDSVFASAYKAASEMDDDKERGEALLYLVKSLGGDK